MNFFRLGCLITLVAASAGAASAQVLNFQIDAQYRGIVKKGFNSIGSAGIHVTPGPDGNFRVAGSGRVTHPKDKAKIYEFKVDMAFQLKGDKVSYISANNSCPAGSEDLKGAIEKLLPFMHVVAALSGTPEANRTISTPHGTYTLHQAQTPKYTEVTVQEGSELAGKFFLSKDAGQLQIERFRIPSGDNVVLNFVSAN